MNNTVFSILLVAVGLLIGFVIAFVINSLKVSRASKKAESMIANAKKEIEKAKKLCYNVHNVSYISKFVV